MVESLSGYVAKGMEWPTYGGQRSSQKGAALCWGRGQEMLKRLVLIPSRARLPSGTLTFPLEAWFPEGLINNPSQHEGLWALFPHPRVNAVRASKAITWALCGIFSTHVKGTLFTYCSFLFVFKINPQKS